MTFEEIFDTINIGLDPNGETAKRIIAALRASLKVRHAYVEVIQGEWGPYTIEELYERYPEIKAYDEATREDV